MRMWGINDILVNENILLILCFNIFVNDVPQSRYISHEQKTYERMKERGRAIGRERYR